MRKVAGIVLARRGQQQMLLGAKWRRTYGTITNSRRKSQARSGTFQARSSGMLRHAKRGYFWVSGAFQARFRHAWSIQARPGTLRHAKSAILGPQARFRHTQARSHLTPRHAQAHSGTVGEISEKQIWANYSFVCCCCCCRLLLLSGLLRNALEVQIKLTVQQHTRT